LGFAGVSSARDDRVSFDLYIDLCALFEFHLLAVFIFKRVGDSNFTIEMVGAFNRNLGLFRFPGLRVRTDYLFDSAWERSACFILFRRHGCCTLHIPLQQCFALEVRIWSKYLRRFMYGL
jgi:hypothetical protein